MPLKNYGVLKGRAIGRRLGEGQQPHYQVHLIDDTADYRIAINVKSKVSPSELDFFVDEAFRHPVLDTLPDLPLGFTSVVRRPGGAALDFIRANLFDHRLMRRLPHDLPGPDNDLNEKIDRYVQRALLEEDALVYAFGERWGPEPHTKDRYFGFLPGNGIHDIHMNQGNVAQFADQDGVWQDGAVLFHFPATSQWVAVFLKFGSQTWHTDDATGHRIETVAETPPPDALDPLTAPGVSSGAPAQVPAGVPSGVPAGGAVGAPGGAPPAPAVPAPAPAAPAPSAPAPAIPEPAGMVRIIGALVNAVGGAPEAETVTLLNTSPERIDLQGWSLADRMKRAHRLSGLLEPGATVQVRLPPTVQLGNSGGLITLLDAQGLKVDGVAYTKEEASREGWTLVF
jgi:uncharacterized protein YukJ